MGKRDSAGSADAEDSSSKNLDIQWIRWHGDANAKVLRQHSGSLAEGSFFFPHEDPIDEDAALAVRDLRESFSCQGRMLRRQLFPMRLRETWPDVTEL